MGVAWRKRRKVRGDLLQEKHILCKLIGQMFFVHERTVLVSYRIHQESHLLLIKTLEQESL